MTEFESLYYTDNTEYKWEESNALLKETLQPTGDKSDLELEPWHDDSPKANENKEHIWDEDDAFDFEMEASISRLVMDEDDYDFGGNLPNYSSSSTRVPYITPPQVNAFFKP